MFNDHRNFIDGVFSKQASTAQLAVLNPATNETLGYIPDSDQADINAAVAAARRAQGPWERLPAIERASFLRRISAKIRENKARLAELITREQGKVLSLAEVEVNFTADYIDYMAEWARRIEGEVLTSDRPNETILLLRKPIGVVAGILPWNFPFFLIARKMAPALVAGNTIVIKPSEETPLNAFEFAKLVAECDLPPGVFNLVGGGRDAGATLAGHSGVDLVSFTGSVGTGVHIMLAAAPNLTRVNLELGGKAPAIVLASADLDLAANAIYNSRILNSGQVCNCAERVYVERSVVPAFTEKIVALMKAATFGDPLVDRTVTMGPLVSAAQLSKVAAAVETAKSQGAHVALGGRVADRAVGHHYEPTVLVDCNHDMDIMRTETFGPVLPIQAVDSLDEAIRYANDSEYGLTSSIFTNDLNAAMHACRELKFGETYVNREHFEAMQGFHAGRRKSGIGGADGKHGLYEYMETQAIYMQTK
ncbi:aldehyde dehydrogenase A, NAD-linked [Cupriavidus phytorum]|uniref:Aldehyde dehydrogenase A, NAD-linked n=2 Tax=Cupriavidus TaxID=106589 RepID=A0A375CIW8_9BURK|nr:MULTISPECIES: aldehyde dehydrogenase [Cupriavidus]MCO4887877.1 aldehyde dehydrogenase [Cupriavidus sp. WGtm5]PZX34251.1 lactaldehyde dehydrogenase [Cupriavidus alkaliphilus]SOY71845.1 aldehyde dehydrogenase A, NAD-linked [Cupriavidus taiwanensis]